MIRNIIYIFLILFYSCSEEYGMDFISINFGSADSLDIITWNIENFPKNPSTINYVSDLIHAFDNIDIIAATRKAFAVIRLDNPLDEDGLNTLAGINELELVKQIHVSN